MSRVCSLVSVTMRLSRRVSFSGCILTAVVVTIRPVGLACGPRLTGPLLGLTLGDVQPRGCAAAGLFDTLAEALGILEV